MITLIAVCTVLGALIGSFLNVVVWRVPRGESIVTPRSRCPGCSAPIRPRDEVPVVSWLLLRGRCRDCGDRISGRYPLVELTTAVLFGLAALRFYRTERVADSVYALPAFLYLVSIGIALALIDLDTKRLPNVLTLPGYVVAPVMLGAASLAGVGAAPFLRAFLGMAVMFGVYFALWFAVPGAMGFGDVKLSGVLGFYLGWLGLDQLALGLFGGWILGGIAGIGLLVARRADRKSKVPFGPFMIVGALVTVLAGETLVRFWLPS